MKLCCNVVLVVATMFAAGGVPADGQEKEDDLTRKELETFRGKWAGVSGGAEGWALVFDGNKGESLQGTTVNHRFVLKVDSSKNPKTYDQVVTEGQFKGESYRGIYKFDGDTLTICYVTPSSQKARPTEFSTGEKGGEYLQTYKRQKP